MGLIILRPSRAPAGLKDDPRPGVTAWEGRDAAASVLSLSFSSSLRPGGLSSQSPAPLPPSPRRLLSFCLPFTTQPIFNFGIGGGEEGSLMVAFLFSFSFVTFLLAGPPLGAH